MHGIRSVVKWETDPRRYIPEILKSDLNREPNEMEWESWLVDRCLDQLAQVMFGKLTCDELNYVSTRVAALLKTPALQNYFNKKNSLTINLPQLDSMNITNFG